MKIFHLGLLILLCVYCSTKNVATIYSTWPHNKNCYSQGLFFLNDTHLFQTCGLQDRSYFHIMQYSSSPFQIRQKFSTGIPWKSKIFLQGAILFKNFLYILTWRDRIVYKLDPSNFSVVKELSWAKDGWGLTTNGTHMFTTDGSQYIYLVDQQFVEVQKKSITGISGVKQAKMNELEYVNGSIYANIYLDSKIVKIDYQSATVVDEIDGSKLIENQVLLLRDQVINGIAYDKVGKYFVMTGKHWSKFYQVKYELVLFQNNLKIIMVALLVAAIFI